MQILKSRAFPSIRIPSAKYRAGQTCLMIQEIIRKKWQKERHIVSGFHSFVDKVYNFRGHYWGLIGHYSLMSCRRILLPPSFGQMKKDILTMNAANSYELSVTNCKSNQRHVSRNYDLFSIRI